MNILSKTIWQILARAKLNSSQLPVRYTAISKLGDTGGYNDIQKLLPILFEEDQLLRNTAARSIKSIIERLDEDQAEDAGSQIIDKFEAAESLTEKISVIEVMKLLPINIREIALGPLVIESGEDLRYALITSLEDTSDLSILDDVLTVSDTNDLVLRRMALQTWYKGIENQDIDDIIDYCSPRIHYLIRATYELRSDGAFLRKVLSYAAKSELSLPKAYPDFIIRYMTELLGTWEYDPDAYRSLHAVMVPSYFTFEDTTEEKPFVIL